MDTNKLMQLLLEKVVSMESSFTEIKAEIRDLRDDVKTCMKDIYETKKDVQDLTKALRFYDAKIGEHDREIFQIKNN
ncbi:hypothetical protein [Aneurinibacillus terranovensis]|uniref:hypothetical protein n=1 Tax=Aneurinibacillus terranovensis TaxID=278991 RepID=UPI000422F3EC|nr:hypothetical protein [Aneurinibacillus terranovensis]